MENLQVNDMQHIDRYTTRIVVHIVSFRTRNSPNRA